MNERRLNAKELAEYLNISLSTVKRYANRENVNFPRSFVVGKRRFWLESDVEDYIKGNPEARA